MAHISCSLNFKTVGIKKHEMRPAKREETLCNCVLLFFSNVVLNICPQWLSAVNVLLMIQTT